MSVTWDYDSIKATFLEQSRVKQAGLIATLLLFSTTANLNDWIYNYMGFVYFAGTGGFLQYLEEAPLWANLFFPGVAYFGLDEERLNFMGALYFARMLTSVQYALVLGFIWNFFATTVDSLLDTYVGADDWETVLGSGFSWRTNTMVVAVLAMMVDSTSGWMDYGVRVNWQLWFWWATIYWTAGDFSIVSAVQYLFYNLTISGNLFWLWILRGQSGGNAMWGN
jgi:hypothetical protein